jgi:EEF1A N-terminal glycine/lysine methyltransferase
MAEGSDASDTEELGGLFPEPEGYYKPHPAPTKVVFTRSKASNSYAPSSPEVANPRPLTFELRLVGQHSLWAHYLWNAAKVLADYFDSNPNLVRGKTVLELGAAGALPSFTVACNGSEKVSGS